MVWSAAWARADQVEQHPVLAQPLGVGQGAPAAGQGEEQLGDQGGRGEAGALATARVQAGEGVEALPEVEAPAQGVDQELSPMGGGLIGGGEGAVELGFLFADRGHGVTSPYR